MQKTSQNNQPSLLETQKDNPVFKEINNSRSRHFNSAIDIYIDSFPANERHSRKVIKDRLDSGKSRMLIGLLQNKVIMVCLLFNLSESEFILLDYMAVSDKFRGKGIGTLFMRHLSKLLKNTDKYLILEVENPKYGYNKEQRKSRIEFYKKNGAKMLKDVRYILPALDGSTPTEMNLMLLPKYHKQKMKKTAVHNLILQIYKEVYNRSGNDPLLNSFINEIPEQVNFI